MVLTAEEIADRLRMFSVGQASGDGVVNPEVYVAPKGMETNNSPDSIQQKIDAFLQEVHPIGQIDPRFENLPEVTENLLAVTTDFIDNKYIADPALVLERGTDAEIANLGRAVIPMLSSGFSQQGVGALFYLAYHLKDPSNEDAYVLDGAEEISNMEHDVSYLDLPDSVLSGGNGNPPMPSISDESREAQAYAFLAASTLRLFTKDEDNYIKAFNHILLGYSRFYRYKIPISVANPTTEALKTLSHYLSHGRIFKNTLFRILYLGGGTTTADGLRKFLYEMHLANTGLHIVSIFVRLCGVLNCSPAILLTTIASQEYERQVHTLMTMLQLIANNDNNHVRKMWKYGRLFDETFMSPLQTKSCPVLTCILASALQSESAKTDENILNIAQLANVSPEKKRLCRAAGQMIIKMIRRHNAESR